MFARWEGGKEVSGRRAWGIFGGWVRGVEGLGGGERGGRGLRGFLGKRFLLRKRDWGGMLWVGWAG